MRITASQLRRIIKEETQNILIEKALSSDEVGPQEWHHSSERANQYAEKLLKSNVCGQKPSKNLVDQIANLLNVDIKDEDVREDLVKAFKIILEHFEGEESSREEDFFKSTPGKDWVSKMSNLLHGMGGGGTFVTGESRKIGISQLRRIINEEVQFVTRRRRI